MVSTGFCREACQAGNMAAAVDMKTAKIDMKTTKSGFTSVGIESM
jgi:hypothetical protein